MPKVTQQLDFFLQGFLPFTTQGVSCAVALYATAPKQADAFSKGSLGALCKSLPILTLPVRRAVVSTFGPVSEQARRSRPQSAQSTHGERGLRKEMKLPGSPVKASVYPVHSSDPPSCRVHCPM